MCVLYAANMAVDNSPDFRFVVKNEQNNYTRIFIGGFSQGACLSYHIGLSFEHTLCGIIPFCCYRFSQTRINEKNIENLNIFGIFRGEVHLSFLIMQ